MGFLINFVIIFALCWIIGAFVIPYFLLKDYRFNYIPTKLDSKTKKAIQSLNKIKGKRKFVRACFNHVDKMFSSEERKILRGYLAAIKVYKPSQLIKKRDYDSCSVQNLYLEILLIKSRRFKREEIRKKYSFVNFVLHKYLQVKLGNKWLDLDPWGYDVGVAFGKHASGFYFH